MILRTMVRSACILCAAFVCIAAPLTASGGVSTVQRLFTGVYYYDGSSYSIAASGFSAPYSAGFIGGGEARSFVIFNLPSIVEPITDVTLKIQAYGTYAAGGAENQTVNFYDISPSLFNDIFFGTNTGTVFDDFGNGPPTSTGTGPGKFYGSVTYPVSTPSTDVLQVHLNSNAIADIAATVGSFGIGIALPDDGFNAIPDDSFAFAGSDTFVISLVVTTGVPEASSLALCSLTVGAAVFVARRRRK